MPARVPLWISGKRSQRVHLHAVANHALPEADFGSAFGSNRRARRGAAGEVRRDGGCCNRGAIQAQRRAELKPPYGRTAYGAIDRQRSTFLLGRSRRSRRSTQVGAQADYRLRGSRRFEGVPRAAFVNHDCLVGGNISENHLLSGPRPPDRDFRDLG